MNKIIKKTYWKVMPENIREKIRELIFACKGRKAIEELRVLADQEGANRKEYQKIVEFLEKNKLGVYNYDFIKKYADLRIDVYRDEECGLFYVLRNGKKLYFKRDYDSEELVRNYYRTILLEQDADSPHRYTSEEFFVEGGVLVDCGGAEGFFMLDAIEKIDKGIVFEAEDDWVEALNKTFEPYKNKVEIIKKYVSDISDDVYIKLDDILDKDIKEIAIKMDIEGYEQKALEGAQSVIHMIPRVILFVAAYHKPEDYNKIKEWIQMNGEYKIQESNGFMVNLWEKKLKEPFWRKGIIRAKKVK